jgi:hypothetical protein
MYIPYLQYRNTSIISYVQSDKPRHKKQTVIAFRDQSGQRVKTYTGTITAGAKKRLSKAVSLLIQSTPTRKVYNQWLQRQQYFKINFITLTISDSTRNLSAKEAHSELLEPMLLWLRRKQQMRSYVWKAELQERGQIHYHITADCYVDLKELRQAWNNLQEKAGLLDDFARKYGHRNPNSTDIHSVKKVKNIEAYLIKYISKSDQNQTATTGKVWDCSTNLKKAEYYTTLSNSETETYISNGIQKGYIRPFYSTNFSIFTIIKGSIYETFTEGDKANYKTHLQAIRYG